jgi:hypothetical protein
MLDKINSAYTRAYISQHYEDWDDRIFENYDINNYLKTLDELDSDIVIVTSRSHNGKWFCNLDMGRLHNGLRGVDQLGESIRYFHAKNKPVITYFSTVYDKVLYERHPEWRQVGIDGIPVLADRGSYGKVVCLNSPYKEYLLTMIRKLINKYSVDGILFDMPFFEHNPCYCDSCKRMFKSMYNSEIPLEKDWANPNYRNFIKFRNDTNYLFVKEICDQVKRLNPKIATYVQYLLLKEPNRLPGQDLRIPTSADYIYTDIYFLTGSLQISILTKINNGLCKNIPEIGIMTRPGSHNDTPNMKTLDHLRSEAFTAIANGGAVHLFDIMWADGSLQKEMWDRNRQIFAETNQRKRWLGGNPIKSVAVYFSEATRIWFGHDDIFNRYDAHFFGMCRAMIEEHIPFNIITQLDKENLSEYKALVLPNTACMSKKEVSAIEEFVKEGGGLVCTRKTSLFDSEGEFCGEYQLKDVLGVSYISDTSTYSRVYSQYDKFEEIAKRIPEDGLITSWDEVQKVEAKGAEVLAKVVFPYTEPKGDNFINIMANPPSVPSNWPACTVNTYGKGKAVYFLGSIDRDYLMLSFPELKYLIVDGIKIAIKTELDVQLEAPMSVEMTVFDRKDYNQKVIHLINVQPQLGKTVAGFKNEMTEKKENDLFSGLSGTTRNLIQEILPVYNLKLKVKAYRDIEKVTLQPENIILDYEIENGFLATFISKLNIHSMVVIDFN